MDVEAVLDRLHAFGHIGYTDDPKSDAHVKNRLLLTAEGARRMEYSKGYIQDDPDPRIAVAFGANSQFQIDSPGAAQHQELVNRGTSPELIRAYLQLVADLARSVRSGELVRLAELPDDGPTGQLFSWDGTLAPW
jgi:hypothetical protein